MATTTIFPDGDIQTQWDTTEPSSPTTHYTKVDEGTGSPSDADYNETTVHGDTDEFSFGSTPANADQITEVALKVRGKITDSSNAAHFHVELWHTGTTVQVGSTKTIFGTSGGDANFGGSGTLATVTLTWTGLTLTKAQADSLSAKYIFQTS